MPPVKGTMGIFLSKTYTITKAIRVAKTKGGIAIFKSCSFLKYIIKKISNGPKSVKNFIMGLPIQ